MLLPLFKYALSERPDFIDPVYLLLHQLVMLEASLLR